MTVSGGTMDRTIKDAESTEWVVAIAGQSVEQAQVPIGTIVTFRTKGSTRIAKTGEAAKDVRAMPDAELLALLANAMPDAG
jgi:hypothetical protein